MIEINTIESVLKKKLDKFMCISCYKIFENPGRFSCRAGPVFRLDRYNRVRFRVSVRVKARL